MPALGLGDGRAVVERAGEADGAVDLLGEDVGGDAAAGIARAGQNVEHLDPVREHGVAVGPVEFGAGGDGGQDFGRWR